MRKLTTEEVKKRIIEIHGDRYDLSKIVYKNRRSKVKLVCNEHGGWMTTTEQLYRGQGCPTCGGKVVTKENSLKDNFSKLLPEWDYKKNNIKPSEIGYGSNREVWWICPENHSYLMSPKTRTRKGMEQKCPFCVNRRIDFSNSLSSLKPQWLLQWNYYKNKKITPDSIGINSNKKVWWKCSEGHEWFVSPNQRLQSNTDCPNCAVSGYKTELDGFLYLHMIQIDSIKGLKYGITNFPKKRLRNLKIMNKRDSDFTDKLEIYNLFTFQGDGKRILEIEGELRSTYGKNFFKKSTLPHGYTETIRFVETTPLVIFRKLKSEGLIIQSNNLNNY